VDSSFSTFEYCFLKSVNRTYKYGSLKVNLHQLPVDKVKVCRWTYIFTDRLYDFPLYLQLNLALYKRLNGYKPFLYNITIDACKFIVNRNSSPVAAFIYNLFSPYSNMNHPCPYNVSPHKINTIYDLIVRPFQHDVMVDKAPTSHLNQQLTNVLPFPKGDYGFFSIWYARGIKRAYVNVYGTLS